MLSYFTVEGLTRLNFVGKSCSSRSRRTYVDLAVKRQFFKLFGVFQTDQFGKELRFLSSNIFLVILYYSETLSSYSEYQLCY